VHSRRGREVKLSRAMKGTIMGYKAKTRRRLPIDRVSRLPDTANMGHCPNNYQIKNKVHYSGAALRVEYVQNNL
jgi:hypothetical protein